MKQISGATEGTFEAAKESIFDSRVRSAVIIEDGVYISCNFSITDPEHFGFARNSVETPHPGCPSCGFLHGKGLEVAFRHRVHPSCAPVSHKNIVARFCYTDGTFRRVAVGLHGSSEHRPGHRLPALVYPLLPDRKSVV